CEVNAGHQIDQRRQDGFEGVHLVDILQAHQPKDGKPQDPDARSEVAAVERDKELKRYGSQAVTGVSGGFDLGKPAEDALRHEERCGKQEKKGNEPFEGIRRSPREKQRTEKAAGYADQPESPDPKTRGGKMFPIAIRASDRADQERDSACRIGLDRRHAKGEKGRKRQDRAASRDGVHRAGENGRSGEKEDLGRGGHGDCQRELPDALRTSARFGRQILTPAIGKRGEHPGPADREFARPRYPPVRPAWRDGCRTMGKLARGWRRLRSRRRHFGHERGSRASRAAPGSACASLSGKHPPPEGSGFRSPHGRCGSVCPWSRERRPFRRTLRCRWRKARSCSCLSVLRPERESAILRFPRG